MLCQHTVGGKNNIHIYINIFSQGFSVKKKVVVHWNRLGLRKAPLTGTLSTQTCSPYTGSWQALAQSMLARASGWAASRILPHDIWSHVTRVQARKFPLLLRTGSFQERTDWSARTHRDHNHPRGCWTLPRLWTLHALSGSQSPNKAGLLQTQRLSPGFGEAPELTSLLCSVRSAWARLELRMPAFTQLLAGKALSPLLWEKLSPSHLCLPHIQKTTSIPAAGRDPFFLEKLPVPVSSRKATSCLKPCCRWKVEPDALVTQPRNNSSTAPQGETSCGCCFCETQALHTYWKHIITLGKPTQGRGAVSQRDWPTPATSAFWSAQGHFSMFTSTTSRRTEAPVHAARHLGGDLPWLHQRWDARSTPRQCSLPAQQPSISSSVAHSGHVQPAPVCMGEVPLPVSDRLPQDLWLADPGKSFSSGQTPLTCLYEEDICILFL